MCFPPKDNRNHRFVDEGAKTWQDIIIPVEEQDVTNVGKTRIDHPPVITMFEGGMVTIPSHG